jgi:hypothetical protein
MCTLINLGSNQAEFQLAILVVVVIEHVHGTQAPDY